LQGKSETDLLLRQDHGKKRGIIETGRVWSRPVFLISHWNTDLHRIFLASMAIYYSEIQKTEMEQFCIVIFNDTMMSSSDTITYKIGEVAQRAHVNKEMIRYYERRDLITKPERRRSGYRIFTQKQIDEIRFIKRAQELGFTLREIKGMLALRVDENVPCEEVRAEARKKVQDVTQKIKDLEQIKRVLLDLIDSCLKNTQTEGCVILNAMEGENEIGEKL